jgi:hypothetical protein
MAMTFPVGGGGGDFKRLPSGTHRAVCNMVADLGIQPGSGMYPAPKRQVVIRWECPDERTEYKKGDEMMEGPLTISRTFTASMNEKAGLRKVLEGWRGRKFTDDEAAHFDVSTILGKACLLSVSETEKGGETYANVSTVSPLMKGMEAPKAENPLLYYADDSRRQFDALPKWVQEKIEKQLPAKTETSRDDELADRHSNPFPDDDIPF